MQYSDQNMQSSSIASTGNESIDREAREPGRPSRRSFRCPCSLPDCEGLLSSRLRLVYPGRTMKLPATRVALASVTLILLQKTVVTACAVTGPNCTAGTRTHGAWASGGCHARTCARRVKDLECGLHASRRPPILVCSGRNAKRSTCILRSRNTSAEVR